jgi:hypothetical protein
VQEQSVAVSSHSRIAWARTMRARPRAVCGWRVRAATQRPACPRRRFAAAPVPRRVRTRRVWRRRGLPCAGPRRRRSGAGRCRSWSRHPWRALLSSLARAGPC